MIVTLLIVILFLSILIIVHELGHFIAGKRMGVQVMEFGLGYPPKIVGFKRGSTTYSLNWIPIGGFVKLKGEGGEQQRDKDSFAHKKIWQRIIILSSGVGMNLVLAAVILSIGFMIGLPTAIDDTNSGGQIRSPKIQILAVEAGSPAQSADIRIGDSIVTINGLKFNTVEDLQNYNRDKINQAITVVLKRGKQQLTKTIILTQAQDETRGVMGVSLVKTGLVTYPWYESIWRGIKATVFLTGQIIYLFGLLIKRLLVGQAVTMDVTGPVGIVVLTNQVAQMGITYLLQFVALISINLAIINFFPFPALDGGRVLFLVIEKIRRRRINPTVENLVHNIGFIVLLIFVFIITVSDVRKFGGPVFTFIKNIFS